MTAATGYRPARPAGTTPEGSGPAVVAAAGSPERAAALCGTTTRRAEGSAARPARPATRSAAVRNVPLTAPDGGAAPAEHPAAVAAQAAAERYPAHSAVLAERYGERHVPPAQHDQGDRFRPRGDA